MTFQPPDYTNLDWVDDTPNFFLDPVNLKIYNNEPVAPFADKYCEINMVTPPTNYSTEFTFGDAATTEVIGPFDSTTCATITYSAELYDGSPLPSFLTFNSTEVSFLIDPLYSDLGNYTIYVTGTDELGDEFTMEWNLTVIEQVIEVILNTAPPFLLSDPADQEMDVLEVKTYQIARADDDDGDGVTIEAFLNTASPLPGFINFESRKFTFTPEEDDDGVYLITIQLTDDNPNPLSMYYQFNLIVNALEESGDSNTEEETGTDSGSGEGGSGPGSSPGQPSGYNPFDSIEASIEEENVSTELSAKIKEVSVKGEVTIVFSESIIE